MLKNKKPRKRPVKRSRTSKPAVRAVSSKKKIAKKRRRLMLPIHKRLALHPINLLFLVCVGVFIVAWTWHAMADTYTVTAEVLAPALTEGAQITEPSDGASFTSQPIEVTGSCPASSYVELTNNGSSSGTSWCVSGTFQIQTGLYVGANVLNAQDYNITNNPGPTSSNITLSYTPPASATGLTLPTSESSSGSGKSASNKLVTSSETPILLSTNFSFQTFVTGQPYTGIINVQGGSLPYQLEISWGDGSSQSLTVNSAQSLTLSHTYYRHGYYPINITATDSKGEKQYLQIAVFIRVPGATSFLATPTFKQPPPSLFSRFYNSMKGWLILIWPSYLVIVLLVFSFWLGEKEAYRKITYHFRRNRRHRLA
jgi:hypothetical protein